MVFIDKSSSKLIDQTKSSIRTHKKNCILQYITRCLIAIAIGLKKNKSLALFNSTNNFVCGVVREQNFAENNKYGQLYFFLG